jgi:predicted dehydrogenase
MIPKPFLWGVVGTGQAARDFAADLPFVTERPCAIKAVLGPEGSADLQQFALEFQVPQTYVDMKAFLEEAKVDAVFVAAPATFRYPYTVRCLQGGRPVLCAAPMSLSMAHASMLAEVAKRTGVFLMEGLPLRFLPSCYSVLSILKTHDLGELLSIEATLSDIADLPQDMDLDITKLAGSQDLSAYPVFLSLFLLGKPRSVKAEISFKEEGFEENTLCLLTFDKGKKARLELRRLVADGRPRKEDRAIIRGTKGSITMVDPWHGHPDQIIITLSDGEGSQRECTWEGKGMHFEVTEMLRCLHQGKRSSELMPHWMSVQLASVLEEIRHQVEKEEDSVLLTV